MKQLYFRPDRSDYTTGIILILIVACFSIPYLFLMVEIKKAVYNFGLFNWLISLAKFFVYSLFAPLIFLFSLSIVRKSRPLAGFYTFLFIALYFLLIMTILIYYKYFGFLPHFNLLIRVEEGSQLAGMLYYQLLGIEEWITIILLFLSLGLAYIYLRMPVRRQIKSDIKILMIFLVIALNYGFIKVQNHRYGSTEVETKLGSPAAVLHLGLLPVYSEFISSDFSHHTKPVKYPGKINKDNIRQNEMARFRNANIIIVQIESLDKQAVDYLINGELVMPFLHKFKNNSVYFENFFSQHSGGSSTDSDLSMLTSLLPLQNHVGLLTADYNHIQSLLMVLKKKGYITVAMNPVNGQFFNKNVAYPKIGFDHFYDEKFYTGRASGWYSKDRDFYDQSIEMIKKISMPFFVYVINIQSHGPFRNYSETSRREFNFEKTNYTRLKTDYLISMNEIDHALEHFFNLLNESGLLDNTILLIYGDHNGRALNDTDCLAECIPLFIYHPDITPGIKSQPGSQLDIAPTLLDLLDIPEPGGWLGTSLFYKGRKAVLFNNLKVIEFDNKSLKVSAGADYMAYLKFSNSLVE